MAKRKPFLATLLSRLAAVRAAPSTPESKALLHEALEGASGLVLAKTAGLVADVACGCEADEGSLDSFGDARVGDIAWAEEFFPDLLSAYRRCCDKPYERDSGAFGKVALAIALDRMQWHEPTPFLVGLTYVQMEPGEEGPIDAAAALRARSIAALVRLRHPERLTMIADMLWDNWTAAKVGAARAALYEGSEAAAVLLRAKALAGEPPPPGNAAETMGAVFTSLLGLRGGRDVGFIGRFMNDRAHMYAVREQAAMTLGESRLPEALEALRHAWSRPRGQDEPFPQQEKEWLILGVAMHATDEAIEALAEWARDGGSENRELILSMARDVFGTDSSRYARLKAATRNA